MKRSEVKLHILLESTEAFNALQNKLEQALICSFQWKKYRLEHHHIARCLGLVLVFDSYRKPDDTSMYVLWGELDATLMNSEYSPYNDINTYEWQEIVDLSYVFITILQAANCGIWTTPTAQDRNDMETHQRLMYPDGHS